MCNYAPCFLSFMRLGTVAGSKVSESDVVHCTRGKKEYHIFSCVLMCSPVSNVILCTFEDVSS